MDQDELRKRAHRYRHMAATLVNDPKAVEALLQLAAEYKKLAEEIEAGQQPEEPSK